MIIRIVKMSFNKCEIKKFIDIFDEAQRLIRNSEGCQSLKLIQDIENENVFFTLSEWQNEIYLNKYRQSELFKSTWSKTKVLFDKPPEAWSTETI